MARTKQQLINYHTGSKTAQPQITDVKFGEIVVRHNFESPELLIKVSSGTSGQEGYGEWFVPFISSGAVSDAIEAAIINSEGSINSEITNIQNSLSGFSAYVETHYATSADTVAAIEAAKIEAEIASSAYTDSQIQMLSAVTSAYVEGVNTAIETRLQGDESKISALEAFSGLVESDYATKEFVGSASGYAYDTAVSTLIGEEEDGVDADTIWGAKNYASSLTTTLSGNLVDYVTQEIADAASDISDLSGSVVELSGAVETMSADVKTYIDNELSTVYTYQGSVADMTALEAVENPEVGDVYNVVAANGVPGDSGYTPAGTNYAWNGSEWDALGGVVDLSNYTTTATTDAIDTRVTALESYKNESSGNIETLSASVVELSGSVETNYATSADTVAAIQAAKDEAVTSAYTASTSYTDEQIAILSGISSAYTDQLASNIDSKLQNYAYSSITHNEIEEAKATVIGSAVTSSADPQTITGLKLYSDEKDRQLREDVDTAINALSGLVMGDFSGVESAITGLDSRIDELEASAGTWNEKTATAIQGAEFATVSSSDSHFDGGEGSGATVDSNAKLSYTEGGAIKLDLSELIIDCGDFE